MEVLGLLRQALLISFLVFVMMLLVDFVDHATQRRVSAYIQGGCLRQYSLASFLGSTPGCLGAFMNVSLYVHGMISFGAIVGGMIATSGDEAFVMLVQFPITALVLFASLFVSGIMFAWVADKAILIFRLTPSAYCADHQCEQCLWGREEEEAVVPILSPLNAMSTACNRSFPRFLVLTVAAGFLFLVMVGVLGPASWDWKRIAFIALALFSLYVTLSCSQHYLHAHIWDHIIKSHLWRVFLWTFGALLLVNWGLASWNLGAVIHEHMWLVLIIGALLGVIPESGPHLIFVMMYSQGLIPFSVLFTASFVQDGHGMLPMLSFSVKDSLLIKGFNLVFGLAVGGILLILGL
jgi:hypothetical protein